VAPACIRQCPGRARHFGDLNDPGSGVYKLVVDWEVALPLHAEFSTEPNHFYVPPFGPLPLLEDGTVDEASDRIPLAMLEELFGSAVGSALATLREERAKKIAGNGSDLMDLLISYRWSEMLGGYHQAPI
jgi:hypothetical protein